MNIEELKAAVNEFASCYTYIANYEINNDLSAITHQRIASSIPAIWNTDVKTSYVFNRDILILSNNATQRKLVWLRQE